MKKEITAAYMHELLKDALLRDDGVLTEAELMRVPTMSVDERRELNVRLLDWMIGRSPSADTLGWFIGQFVTNDGERTTRACTGYQQAVSVFCIGGIVPSVNLRGHTTDILNSRMTVGRLILVWLVLTRGQCHGADDCYSQQQSFCIVINKTHNLFAI
jgi:hypothetical protein